MSTLAVSQIEDLAGSAKVSIGGGSPALTFETSSVERFKVDDSGNISFNSGYGSSAVAYGCRAWVNFNGTGTVAIRDSGNVSSITDNGTGRYSINFSTALVDENYAANCNASPPAAYTDGFFPITSFNTTQVNVETLMSNYYDPSVVCVQVVR